MWTINMALGYLAAVLCMTNGVMFGNSLFIAFSLGIGLAVYILDKTLEYRLIHLLYKQALRPMDNEEWENL
jgi:hypothetical protein